MSIATTADFESAPSRPLSIPLVSAAVSVALADWLFYGWEIGISLALFFGVLGLAAVASHREHATRKIQIIMAAIFVAGLLALVENVSELSVIGGTPATAMFVYVQTAPETTSWQRNLFEAVTIPFRGPFQLIGDLIGTLRQMKMWTPEWLGLVAAGLLLILIQIILRKPNSWLLAANAATLALVLYACCFINAPWLVATYNVEHSREVSGTGLNLDVQYLGSLGPQARLVLESHRKEVPALLIAMDRQFSDARDLLSRPENWRVWSFRAWRIKRYLANNPDTPSNPSNSGQG